MNGNHQVDRANRARIAVASALTAGALLLAPVGAAAMAPGVADAENHGSDPALIPWTVSLNSLPDAPDQWGSGPASTMVEDNSITSA